jgi:para-nitrobenzyl esterase
MTHRLFLVCAAATLLSACAGDDDSSSGPAGPDLIQSGTLIELGNGSLHGSVDGRARRFLGIPYAKPPVGELRFRAPEPAEPWDGVLPATEFGSPCPQPQWIQGPESVEENCLFLNVWTPEPAPDAALPVMVWLPGGGNQNGSASDLSPLTGNAHIYDGRDLAESHGVVVVTINYRVGVMGFFSHPGLRAEGSRSGNQGLADQQLAMRWVQENIVAFGGDPDNVTLFGESAGAQDTCLQVVSPTARGLFHRGIAESGGCMTYRPEAAIAEQQVQAFAEAVGCSGAADELACLRDKPVRDLLIAAPLDGGSPDAPGGRQFSGGTPRWEFNPVVDGELIPAQPRELVAAQDFAKVPYLTGSNFEEGRLFLLSVTTPVTTDAEYQAALQRLFGNFAAEAAVLYPVSAFATPQDALVRVWGDSRLVCSTTETARRLAANGASVYAYDFARPIPSLEGLGATHGVELPYVFGTLQNPGTDDAGLSDAMQGYWTRFAASADPNGAGALAWPSFNDTSEERMDFNVPSSVIAGFRSAECDFWATVHDAAFP